MAIKAIGTITENLNDGKRVRVDWIKVGPLREWYFYSYRKTVWRVVPEKWTSDGLIKFAFEEEPQDIHRFRNDPYWADRFGDGIEKMLRLSVTTESLKRRRMNPTSRTRSKM